MVDVTLLGTTGTSPTPQNYLSSAIINVKGSKILIDCGEGTQASIKELKLKFKNIDVICITHFHVDHMLGLVGILLTMNSTGKTDPLTIIIPNGTRHLLRGQLLLATQLDYPINIISTSTNECAFSNEYFQIASLSVRHTVPTLGYKIIVKRNPQFQPEIAKKYDIPVEYWKQLQSGQDLTLNDKTYQAQEFLIARQSSFELCYIMDTRYFRGLLNFCHNADLLICDATFVGDNEKDKILAKIKKHMTFLSAAELARDAKCSELWLTHFSHRISDPLAYEDFVTTIFNNTVIGQTHLRKQFTYKEKNTC